MLVRERGLLMMATAIVRESDPKPLNPHVTTPRLGGSRGHSK